MLGLLEFIDFNYGSRESFEENHLSNSVSFLDNGILELADVLEDHLDFSSITRIDNSSEYDESAFGERASAFNLWEVTFRGCQGESSAKEMAVHGFDDEVFLGL